MKIDCRIFSHLIGHLGDPLSIFQPWGLLERHNFKSIPKDLVKNCFSKIHFDEVDDYYIKLFIDPLHRFSRKTKYLEGNKSYELLS